MDKSPAKRCTRALSCRTCPKGHMAAAVAAVAAVRRSVSMLRPCCRGKDAQIIRRQMHSTDETGVKSEKHRHLQRDGFLHRDWTTRRMVDIHDHSQDGHEIVRPLTTAITRDAGGIRDYSTDGRACSQLDSGDHLEQPTPPNINTMKQAVLTGSSAESSLYFVDGGGPRSAA